jgi:hypothetical protein
VSCPVERSGSYALQWVKASQHRTRRINPTVLRILFGEQPREWSGPSLDTALSIEKFVLLSIEASNRTPERREEYRTFSIWAEGLLRSMDELEQSCYAAKRYSELIHHQIMDELSFEEKLSYNRHVYFDKNAYIRIFSLLDKLGTLLNRLLYLHTERFKSRFSYFTVLRNMRENRLFAELSKPLDALKERHQGALNRLRGRRNLETHQMNAELMDDLSQSLLAQHGERLQLENLQSNMADLDEGWSMVEGSLGHAFRFACERLRNTNKN